MRNKSIIKPAASLVGRCFHTFDKKTGQVKCQGRVVASPEPGWYLVVYYEWMMGQESYESLVPFKEMTTWWFYADKEDMGYSAQYGAARHLMAKDFFKESGDE